MIEAMACGTPVIAFRRGAVPEVVSEGVDGFVVDDPAGMVEAIGRLDHLDRRRVRASNVPCTSRRLRGARWST